MNYSEIQSFLQKNADATYKAFNMKLIPELDDCYGVRIPIIRSLAKTLSKQNIDEQTMENLWISNIHEEKLLLGLLIGQIKFTTFEAAQLTLLRFAEKVDNWVVCDLFVSALKPVIKRYHEAFYKTAKELANHQNDWEIRLGLVMMLSYYIEAQKIDEILKISNSIRSDAYYVRMANAWMLSYMYIADKKKTTDFLSHSQLDSWTINKAIQKIRESNRVANDDKISVLQYKR